MAHPFDTISNKLNIGARGIDGKKSVRNMNAALAPKNKLKRAQTGADSGTAHSDMIGRYLARKQYVNLYLRPKT